VIHEFRVNIFNKYSFVVMLIFCQLMSWASGIASPFAEQQNQVTGRVIDADSGVPLAGARIEVKGTSVMTSTSEDGTYRLDLPARAEVLLVSYMGYRSTEVAINGRSTIHISLVSDIRALEDVVVVGYGTQSRTKVTGAVNQVGAEVFANRPITNLAQGLQGAIPNLNISFGDGQLNRGGTFNLRGFTSINGGSPLILIDGTPGNINMLNPEDVESVTVLKDASSAAIYGARAAFGVVLVTTKKGQSGKPQIRYTNNFGTGSPIRIPRVLMNSLEHARIQNEAYRGYANTDAPGLAAVIDYLEQREADPSLPELGIDASGNFIRGGNTDWYGEFYNNNMPFSKNYLSISGARESTNYFLSVGHEKREGIYRVATDDFQKYSLRLKMDNQLADWINIFNNIELNQGVYNAPNRYVSDGGYSVYRYLSLYADPYEVIKTANGNYTNGGVVTFGQMTDAGRTIEKQQLLKNTLGFRTNFLDNRLKVNGDYTYFVTQSREDIQSFSMMYENRADNLVTFASPDYYRSSFGENKHHIINLFAEYEQRVNDHTFKGLIGYNQELYQVDNFFARRNDNITQDLGSLNLTTGIPTLGAGKSEWALQGYFGRLNYDYKSKYLVEFNGRYDGTSRFSRETRFGFFPSVSAGWVVSNEDFFSSVSNVVNSLKLRGSYGSLGNQLVSTYAYISSMTPSTASRLLDVGGERPLAVSAPSLVPLSLTWETATTLNGGFDFSMVNNRLDVGFDYYIRETKDMLTRGQQQPAVLGAAEPRENAADLRTKGWELSARWNDRFDLLNKPFSYNFSVVLSDNRSHITRFNNRNKLLSDSYYEGKEVGEIWGYKTLGFFQTDEESHSHADQSRLRLFTGMPLAGDIKFEDIDNSGAIDFGNNTVDDSGDLQIIGNTTPRYSYGISTGFNWYNFTLDVFLQGIGKRQFYPGPEAAVFWGFYNRWDQPVYEHIAGNYWTPENPDAYFPRLRAYEALSTDRSLGATQTRYLQDASYLRLKNVTVGYSLPQSVVSKVKMQGVRVFFSGENLYEWTKLSKAFDPEGINDDTEGGRSNGQGFVYPMMRTFTFGLEINF
ncbi:MAG TPA: TonB-dependent receptor, partial [Sphingobacterium sp.]|nr:TonB-dependent receptor [Sphingobacterium sp.]